MSEPIKDNKVEEPIASYSKIYTYADYMKSGVDEIYEIIRGKIMEMAPAPGNSHQAVCGSLFVEMYKLLENSPCQIRIAPFDVILPIKNEKKDKATTVVQPDISVICDLDKIEEAGCFGPPNLVVEIISPSSSKRDVQDKFSIYEEAGVNEYWVVFPKDAVVTVYVLKDNKYNMSGNFTALDTIQSITLTEVKIDLTKIFQQTV